MVASRLQGPSVLAPSPRPAAVGPLATQRRHRPADGDFAEQEAALRPVPAPGEGLNAKKDAPAGPDAERLAIVQRALAARGAAVHRGATTEEIHRFRCGAPRFNGRPVSEVRDALVSMMQPYLDVGTRFIAEAGRKQAGEMSHHSTIRDVIPLEGLHQQNTGAHWRLVLAIAGRMNQLMLGARALAEDPTKVVEAARAVAEGINAFRQFSLAFNMAAAQTDGEMTADMNFLEGVKVTAEYVRDGATALAIAAGSIYFGPAIAAKAATLGPLGGTLYAAAAHGLLGASIEGTITMAGTALAGGSVDQVGAAAIEKSIDGAWQGEAGANLSTHGAVSPALETTATAVQGALGGAGSAVGSKQDPVKGAVTGALGNLGQNAL